MRKITYIILTQILALVSYLLLQNNENPKPVFDHSHFIESSAIIVERDYDPIVHYQARTIQATWLILSYRERIEPWHDEEQTKRYYHQQKETLNHPPYEMARHQLAQELAQKQAIKETYYAAEKWRLLLSKKSIEASQIPHATYQNTKWVSAFHQDVDADVVRLLLCSSVGKWQTHELPSGDMLLSFVFMRDYDQSRIGLIRRLTENSTFNAWQAAERAF